MAKIPFDAKYRSQIESGEYKVETRDGRPVRIICWDRVAKENTDDDLNICVLVPEDNGEGVYYYHQSGKKWVSDERFDLFIVAPEPELTKFEESLWSFLKLECSPIDHIEKLSDSEKMLFHKYAAELFELARKELEKCNCSDETFVGTESDPRDIKKYTFRDIQDAYKRGHDKGELVGKERAMTEIQRDHEGEEWLSPDVFQAHKEQAYQDGVREGKAEALNDLPKWRVELNDMEYVSYGIIGGCKENPRVYLDGHSIDLYSLKKLPGFNEG